MMYLEFPSWITPEVIPGVPILRWYSLMYLIAFLITYLLFQYQNKRREVPFPTDTVINLFFATILGLLIGGRLLGTLLYDPKGEYLRAPWKIVWPFNDAGQFVGFSGMSFHGGLIGALVGATIFLKKQKLSILEVGDTVINGVPLAYTFGRLGNFINQELYGKATDAPIGMLFEGARPYSLDIPWVAEMAEKTGVPIIPGSTLVNLPRHPSQLYEAFLEGIVLGLIMWFIVRKKSPFRGFSIAFFLIGYSIARYIAEIFREPDAGVGPFLPPLNLSMGQILSILMVGSGIAAMILLYRHSKKQQAIPVITANEPVARNSKKRSRRKK